ncbi:AMP dependent synthetase and ligase [Histoplasma capsulatum G186AR]|uniref:AMP dependent synthetase and ligase n=1 Tax=Ajellomyces capsulatus TaxID=5037 RepID=A0A8H8D8U2_AJECA|nr:AMP dependent synthetase and ligase [Histoplasma capsulatum]QSS75971.1 AMP dependent synthetase and ligase [Histoplasma capsulatum G186AR]
MRGSLVWRLPCKARPRITWLRIGGSSLRVHQVQRRSLLTTSHARGPSEPPLFEQTIGDHFANIVSKYGDKTAVISTHQAQRLTYDELDRKSNALARGLAAGGLPKGDRVAVSLGNSIEFAIVTYALFKLGAVLVPLNPSFNANQVVSALGHLEASHLIMSTEVNLPRREPRPTLSLLHQIVPDLLSSKLESQAVPSLKKIILVNNDDGRVDTTSFKCTTPFASLSSDLIQDMLPIAPQGLSPHDVVNIQFTSGTTSMPKAACLTHRSILNNGVQIGDRMLLTPNDIVCCPPPLFHCFGSILGYMATATHGSAIVFPAESFNAIATLKAVQNERCTALYGVPTMFVEELDLLEEGKVPYEGFQYLRTGIAAGSSIPAELMKKLHKTLNLTELTICYGMTETSPVSAMTTTDDPIEKRISSVGRLMPHVEAKVVDPRDGTKTLPVETKGELVVSGYLVMKEYWGAPERTAEVMVKDEEGKVWMHTGDEATMSPDGYISITGRIKDLIIRGGENIHPLEIENCLFAHPSVSSVSVVGVPDDRYGEVVAAFVIQREEAEQKLTADEVKDWVRKKLSHHLVPKYVFLMNDASGFPKTASGKIQKFKLREQAISMLQGTQ